MALRAARAITTWRQMKTDRQVAIISRMAGQSDPRNFRNLDTFYQHEHKDPEPEVHIPLCLDRLWGIMTSFVCVRLKNRCFDCEFVQLLLVMRSSTHAAACCVIVSFVCCSDFK